MEVRREQVTAFPETGVFQSLGFNDAARVDYTDHDFLAVDKPNPFEVDDAFHTDQTKQGSYLEKIAIADASQFMHLPDIVRAAVNKRASIYGDKLAGVDPMLPVPIIRATELSTGTKQRALVVSRKFTKDAEPTGEVEVEQAWIKVTQLSPEELLSEDVHDRLGSSILAAINFAQIWAKRIRLDHAQFDKDKSEGPAHDGMDVVQAHMVLANIMIPSWAGKQAVPIIYRGYNPQQTVWDEERRRNIAYGRYSEIPTPHYGLHRTGNPPYAHNTSPLRRAADLLNHLQIGSALAGIEPPHSREELKEYASYLSKPYSDSLPEVA